MRTLHRPLFLLGFCALLSPIRVLIAQSGAPPVSVAFAVLTSDIDSRSAKPNDALSLRVVRDLVVGNNIVIPRDAVIQAHVAELPAGEAAASKSLGIVLTEAVLKNGRTVRIEGIISALAAPAGGIQNDPTYSMMHSNEPTAAAGTASSAQSGAAVATAGIQHGGDPSFRLTEASQGAVDMPGISLRWLLTQPPPVTVVETKKKFLRLVSGTQVAIRMAQPTAE